MSTSPAADARTPGADAQPNVGAASDAELVAGSQNATASEVSPYSPTNAAIAKQQTTDASNPVPDTDSSASSSSQPRIQEFKNEVSCRVFDSNTQVDAPARTQNEEDAANMCSADAPKEVNTPSAPKSTSQAQENATIAPAAIGEGNAGAQDAQSNAAFAASPVQDNNTPRSLPNAASLVSVTAAGDETVTAEENSESRQSIAQRIQPALPGLDAALANGAQATQSPFAAKDNGTAGGNNSDDSSGQSSGHSTDQPQRNSKSSDASDSSQTGVQLLSGQASGAQDSSTANGSATASTIAVTTQSAHIAAHVSAQPSPSGDSTSAAKPLANGTPTPNQASAPSASVAPSLPRSLNDVNQAARLYQQVGRAEMHISMDTDALGSIDLRAVVHQGSLSATIGVQRADVQTLLVNELPALQHSLAEKNFQVNHISVLAGSIGSGANPDGQKGNQQDSRPATPAFPSLFRNAPLSALSPSHLSEVAAVTGNSARLSVIA
ncbi:MAG: flagellar hook-length control protein FliK [Candidatus Acidiferrales bacterium]